MECRGRSSSDVFHVAQLHKPTTKVVVAAQKGLELREVGGKRFVDEKVLTDGVEGCLT